MEDTLAGLRLEPPSQEEGLAIVQRMREGDPTATSDFAEAYLGAVARVLARFHPHVDPSDVQTAAEDAVWSFMQRPEQYDSSRLSIMAYLGMAARRDLDNIRTREYRHASRRRDWGSGEEDVELPSDIENLQGNDLDDPARIAELNETIAETMAVLEERIVAVGSDLSEREIEGLILVIEGERSTEVLARTLGWTHLSPEDQRKDVKRFKDRMNKRLERSGVPHA